MQTRSRKLILMVVAFLVCSATQVFSQDPVGGGQPRPSPAAKKTSRVQLEVTAGADKVEGARVILESQEEGVRFSKEVRTNKQGAVTASGVPQGRLKIQVIAKECETFGEVVNLAEDNQTIRIALTKRSAPVSP
ncbi:MAG: hypothetical protein ACR2LM_15025 [Pyrinomonadaceae bacterium]